MNTQTQKTPWYREPWVWLMIAFPMAAVIGGIITIYLAVVTSTGLVVDDYYERGKAINMVLARDEAAARYRLGASIDLDMQGNQAHVLLQSPVVAMPDTLKLSLLHPTQPGHDQVIVLQHAGHGSYSGPVDEISRGSWYVQLESAEWRLSGKLQSPQVVTLVLLPADAMQPH